MSLSPQAQAFGCCTSFPAWVEAARLKYRYSGKALEMAVPRKLLGLKGDAFTFDFHWCDNPTDLKDPISLCTSGDSAPNRRFNYRCIWKQKGTTLKPSQ